jgi:hypothetical protein
LTHANRHTVLKNAPRLALALILLALAGPSLLRAQGAGANRSVEPRALIDVPTAGMLRGGMSSFQADFFHSDGVNAAFAYGLIDRLMVGLSYGATHLIGTEAPDWNDVPGFLVRFRIAEESEGFPAIAVGFESQGAEGFIDDLDRFTIKSPGVYLTGSKNFDASGYLGFHGGVNYSFEHGDNDKDINVFGGIDKSLWSFMALVGEYNFALNDNSGDALGRGRGYLNAGVSFFPGAGIILSFHFKDLLENQPHEGFANRTVRVEFAR